MKIIDIDNELDCLVCEDEDGNTHLIHRGLIEDVDMKTNVDIKKGTLSVDIYVKLKQPQVSLNVCITKDGVSFNKDDEK